MMDMFSAIDIDTIEDLKLANIFFKEKIKVKGN